MAVSGCYGFSCKIDAPVSLIEDEKFDFDVPISPTVCDAREANNNLEDEDEVFLGPVGHKERCVTANSGLQDDDNCKPMSPLNGEQIAELFKEATAVSLFIKSQRLSKNTSQSRENEDVCSVLSKTFIVVDDQNDSNVPEVADQENNLSFPAKSEFSPETISKDNLSQSEYSSNVVIPTTPSRVLRESNYRGQSDVILPSPFKAREARPLANASKFKNSKLPQTQMTLKTRSCFNSPIKAEHVYGMMPEPAKENDKLHVPSQRGLKPPRFVVQPRRRRRTSSTSSSSSISSALSKSNPDLNETFTVLDTSASDPPLIPSACTRKAPATKASLKPLRGSSVLSKKASSVLKPKGKLQPVKALPQPGNVGVKKAPQISRSLGSTPGKQKGSQSSDQKLVRARTPVAVQRSKSFTTPVKAKFEHQKSSLDSEQLGVCHDQTPNAVLRSKSFTTPNTKNGGSISTAQPTKCAQNLTKEGNPKLIATPRKRGSAKETPRKSLTAVPTPVRRRGSVVDNCASKTEVTQVQMRSTDVPKPTTPTGGSSEPKIVVTPPHEVPSNVIKRKSLSVGGQKRRSLLPTPVRINKTTRSHSQKLKPSIKAFGSQGALPLNISPPAEYVVPRIAGVLSDSQLNAKVEPLTSTSSLADPFSPATHLIPAHPDREYFVSRDSHDTNLIQLSPSLPSEGNLIDL